MLASRNCSLRAVRLSDSEFLFNSINSSEIVRFNAPYKPIDEINHMEWLTHILKDPKRELFIIEAQGNAIGTIQLIDIHPIHRNAELTIRISNKDYWGKGLGTEAINLLCQHAFQDLGLHRVWLRVFSDNERAIKSYQKANFNIEGEMKDAAFIDGRFKGVIVMARVNT